MGYATPLIRVRAGAETTGNNNFAVVGIFAQHDAVNLSIAGTGWLADRKTVRAGILLAGSINIIFSLINDSLAALEPGVKCPVKPGRHECA